MTTSPTLARKLFTATNAIIAINTVVLIIMAVNRPMNLLVPDRTSLIDMGANFGLLTCSGEEWRVVTSLFVHVGILHFALNMYALGLVGPMAESLFGWRSFLLIYLFSGIMGSLASLLHDPLNVSAGASGAIFGAYGSCLAFMYVQRDQYPEAILRYHTLLAAGLLACNFAYGMMVPGIDNLAHFGGVLSGAFAGFVLAQLQVSERRRVAYGIPVFLLMVAAFMGVTHAEFDRRGFTFYRAGVVALRNKDWKMAAHCFTRFIQRNPVQPEGWGSRALAYSKFGELKKALEDFNTVVSLLPGSPEPYSSRAWVEDGLGQYDRSIIDASRAIKLDPRYAHAYDIRGYAYMKLGKFDQAFADFEQAKKLDPKHVGAIYHLAKARALHKPGVVNPTDVDRSLAESYVPEEWER